MGSLDGKVAIVTGGSSGIGRAAAIALAREGAKVVVSARRQREGQETVDAIKKAGGTAIFVKTDVTSEKDVQDLVGKTVATYGRLDIAFNNAGVEQALGPLVEHGDEIWQSVMDTNAKGVWLCMKHEIRAMLAKGGGSIVNNASVAGVIGFPGAAIYTASKHAVIGLTKAAALEYGKAGIRVNALSPAAIVTDMYERFTGGSDDFKKQLAAMHPIGRVGRPEEMAEGVVWLASSASSFYTGQSLTMDGGFTAQ